MQNILVLLEALLLYAGMICFDSQDCLSALLRCQEMRREGAIWEEKVDRGGKC
jgi:hypothetical protein